MESIILTKKEFLKMTTETLIVAGVIVLLVVLTFIGLLSRYRKCASDEILVVFGKAGKKR